MGECCICASPCNGTLMRTDPRYNRVRNMLTDEIVPRLPNGGIALCHQCQRGVYFANGFMPFLIKRLRFLAIARESAKAHAGGGQR